MGFLANAWNYGWTAGSIITKAEKEADRICKGIKTTILPDSEENEAEGCKIIFHPEWYEKYADTSSGNEEAYTQEISRDRFDALDVKKNIAAAVNHFGTGNNGDIDIIRTQITATLYMAGLADTDTVFEAINRDSTAYAAVNECVRMYRGEPMDERLIRMDIDKDIDDAALEKLKLFADWEMTYLIGRTGCADEDALTENIMGAHASIMNCLDREAKEMPNNV